MTEGRLQGVAVRGIRACVPKSGRTLAEEGLIPDEAERERLIKSIGVRSRRIAPEGVMTSDLCQRAAEGLLDQLGWARDSIDVLIFVTQNPDYVAPATACALQHRLGLGSCLAFDVNLGCSGYTYGLWVVASLLKTLSIGGRPARGLLLAGDVSSPRLLKGDRATVPLFGDAGTATALEVDPAAGEMTGVFGTDGAGVPHIMIEAGALRMPLMPGGEAWDDVTREKLAKSARLHLNGPEVFTFTLKNVPSLVSQILAASGSTVEDIEHVVFHQANVFMLEHLRKKAGLPAEKVPIAMETYGNTSSASIPLTIADRLSNTFATPTPVLLVGFGIGWSWAALKLHLGPMPQCVVDEYD